ncbi:MAG: FtsX-like permease family protein [Acidobacteria bacterium]|nr:FtsX-like permease family protein [Acidobacteriota bacterium]
MLAFTPLIRVSGDSGTAQAVAEANAIFSTLPMRPPTGEILDFASVNELALPSEGRRAVVDLLRMLGAAAFTLLLLACVTVGHLLLTRGQSRRQEFAIRLALGATRRQLVREPLLEVCVLGCLAGLVAIGIFALMSSALDSLPLMVELSLRPSARVDGFSAALALAFTVLTVAICGIAPAMQAARRDAAEIVARGAGAMELATAKPVWLQAIVVAQVAICVLVVASSSVLIATARNESRAPLGFDPTNVMVARARFSLVSYSEARADGFMVEFAARLSALPQITTARSLREPLDAETLQSRVSRPGSPTERAVFANVVSPTYFDVLRIPLRGRTFEERTRFQAILSQAFADDKTFWDDVDPIGQMLRVPIELNGRIETVIHEVIGVAGDTKYASVRDEGIQLLYVQELTEIGALPVLLVRPEGDAAGLMSTARSVAAQIDGTVPIEIELMDQRLDRHVGPARVLAALMSGISLLAWGVAILGHLRTLFTARGQPHARNRSEDRARRR